MFVVLPKGFLLAPPPASGASKRERRARGEVAGGGSNGFRWGRYEIWPNLSNGLQLFGAGPRLDTRGSEQRACGGGGCGRQWKVLSGRLWLHVMFECLAWRCRTRKITSASKYMVFSLKRFTYSQNGCARQSKDNRPLARSWVGQWIEPKAL